MSNIMVATAAFWMVMALFFTFVFIAVVVGEHAKIIRGDSARVCMMQSFLPAIFWALFFIQMMLK